MLLHFETMKLVHTSTYDFQKNFQIFENQESFGKDALFLTR